MLKKYMKDNSGSALIVAIMVMLVAFILVASFVGNVTASTRIDTNSISLDQAYLVAKSGMRFLEETIDKNNLTGSEVLNYYGTGKNTKINITATDGTALGYCDVYAEEITGGDHQYNLVVIGYYNNTPYKLYKYKAIAEETTVTTTVAAPPGSTVKKAANINYNYGGGSNNFNTGIIGPSLYLGNTTNYFMNGNGTSAGNVASRGDITLSTSNANDGYQSIFSLGKVSFDHSMNIYGEVYCDTFDATANGNHVHIYNTIYAKKQIMIGGADSTFYSLVSGTDTDIGGDGAVINGNVTVGDSSSGGNLYIGLASRYNAKNGKVTINGDVYVNGDVTIKYLNASDVKITGNIYATGTVKIMDSSGNVIYSSEDPSKNNTNGIVGGTIYSGDGEDDGDPRYEGTGGDAILEGKFDNIVNDIQTKLNEEIPVETKPTTTLPTDGAYAGKVYNSLSDITTAPYEKDGFMVYTITESGTINFSVSAALSTQVGGKYPAILIDTLSNSSDPRKIDLYFTNDFRIDDAYGNGNAGKFMVNDHSHSGLVRLFLADHIDIKLGSTQKNSWSFLPLDDGGNIDYNYVPNLYVFSLEVPTSTESGGRDIGILGTQNGATCFPGYWLTPNLKAKLGDNRGFSGSTDDPVTESNCPYVHGMLATDKTTFQCNNNAIKYFDPDSVPNLWSYDTAISQVYQVATS